MDNVIKVLAEKFKRQGVTSEMINTAVEGGTEIRGWVARDEDGTLHFFSSEFGDGKPIYDRDFGAWGTATGEMIELPRQSGPFGDLTYQDEPVEVKLTLSRL